MIINKLDKRALTCSLYPHENWVGEGWLVVPTNLEDVAQKLSPFIVIGQDANGNINSLKKDIEAWEAWKEANPEPEETTPPLSNEELAEENKLLKAQVQALTDRNEFMEDCIAEMATQVYA